jgi:hypothetical protein
MDLGINKKYYGNVEVLDEQDYQDEEKVINIINQSEID